MRLGGRLAAAIEVLDDILRRHRPAADALRDWGLSHRFAGAGDRAAIGNIVYDALRRKRSSGWLLGSDTPRALAFGAVLIEWKEPPETLNAALAGDRFAPPPLDTDELDGMSARRLEDAPAEIRADSPAWCVPLLERAFGAGWAEEAAALSGRPPLDLRVNGLKAERARVLDDLAGMNAAACRLAASGIRIPPIDGSGRHPSVQAEAGWRKGWFEVQDEGSQVAAELAGAAEGMQVLDYCAGAGGKTLALSAAMKNRGQIFAHDRDRHRLAPIFERLGRSGSRNVQVVSGSRGLEAMKGQMDLVLVDAPCSGSGTWRRRPDAKWRLTERQLEVRVAEQAAILDEAVGFVRPGGRLVYVTCSVFDAENAGQIDALRARHGNLLPLDHAALWEKHFPGRQGLARADAERGIRLSPLKSGTDGFYVAALARTA
jgi:16S rRNA (cytosine967-C5)-methyltransferase